MEETNSNTQTASVDTPAAAELSPAEYKAKIAELEKQNEGRLRDLQGERKKRQELEAHLNTAPSAPATPDVKPVDELAKVLNPYVGPVEERVKKAEAYLAQLQKDKALDYLSQKTGKSKDSIVSDGELDNKLTSIVRRFRLSGDVYDVTTRAWEIYELENLKAQEGERKRQEEASRTQSLPTGTHVPAKVGSREYTEEEFSSMPLGEYDKLSSEGSFLMNKDGKVVYTPHPK